MTGLEVVGGKMPRCRAAVAICLVGVLGAMHARACAQTRPWAIFVMKSDGSQARRIAQAEGHLDHTSPRWSHNDRQIVFDASGGDRGQREFYVVNADGTGLRQVGIFGRADWSPDDKQLGFETEGAIHVENLDGQGRETIAQGYCARWSPDGSQLAVNDRHQLIVVDLASGEERGLFGKQLASLYGGYNWSPDGKWLAVTARVKEGGPRQLMLVSSQGDDRGFKVRFEAEQGGSVSFSPDGKKLVFDNGYKLYQLDVEGAAPPQLMPGQQGKNKDPHWSHDGDWIVFSSDRDTP